VRKTAFDVPRYYFTSVMNPGFAWRSGVRGTNAPHLPPGMVLLVRDSRFAKSCDHLPATAQFRTPEGL